MPGRETVHIGNNSHILDSKYGVFLNHSFNPTCRIESRNVVANVDIKVGDEITFNYNETELEVADPFWSDGKYVCGQKGADICQKL